MPTMGRYCKAVPISMLRLFPGWRENAQNARTEETVAAGAQVLAPRQIHDAGYLYLQENLTVTDGIFLDQNIIFDEYSEEWEEYCRGELSFQPPDAAPAETGTFAGTR